MAGRVAIFIIYTLVKMAPLSIKSSNSAKSTKTRGKIVFGGKSTCKFWVEYVIVYKVQKRWRNDPYCKQLHATTFTDALCLFWCQSGVSTTIIS
jgi:hypothetical protein